MKKKYYYQKEKWIYKNLFDQLSQIQPCEKPIREQLDYVKARLYDTNKRLKKEGFI